MPEKITITFDDGSVKEFPEGTTVEDIISATQPAEPKKVVAAKIDNHLVGRASPLPGGGVLHFLTIDSEEGLSVLRHSNARPATQPGAG